MTRDIIRIAMWSGPRNISTALMRSFGNRSDCAVCDEPFYAFFLTKSGENHPGRDEIIEHHETDWRKVVRFLTGPVQDGKPVFYQKHMAHHMLPDIDDAWLDRVTNCFLLRNPRAMLTSLAKMLPEVRIEDTGLPQQLMLYRQIQERTGGVPIVIDSTDVLLNPRGMLESLCERLGLEFEEAMLSWPAGLRPTDGVWARHWYQSVERSTGFAPYRPKAEIFPTDMTGLLAEAREIYRALYRHRLVA